MYAQIIEPTKPRAELRASDINFLVRQARRLRVPENEIEDLVQDTLETAVRLLPSFRGEAKSTTWLYLILKNTWNNYRRKSDRRERKHCKYSRVFAQQIDRRCVFYVEQGLADKLLREFIAGLEPDTRAVITARWIQGFSRAETAKRLDMQIAAVDYQSRKAKLHFDERFIA